MKLSERSNRKPNLKATEVLDHAAPAEPAVFDIRRDVSPEDWQYIAERINHNLARDNIYDIVQLIVLQAENQSGLGTLETLRFTAHWATQEWFQDEKRRLHNIFLCTKPLVNWLILAPEDKQTLLSGPMGPELRGRLWIDYEQNFKGMSSSFDLPLTLFLLFPEQQDRIRQTCDWPRLQEDLKRALSFDLTSPRAYQAALLTQLLYPGKAQEFLTQELVRSQRQRAHREGKKNFNLNAFATFDLLSAERVWLDGEGKIQIERQKLALAPTQELPPRKLV